MYVYRCSKNLMDHVPAMKVLNQTFFCKSVYSGTYDNEFIISCRHEIYGEVKSRSELPTYLPAAHRGLVNNVTLKNSSKVPRSAVHQEAKDHTLWGLYYTLLVISILCLIIIAIVLKCISVGTAKRWFSFPIKLFVGYTEAKDGSKPIDAESTDNSASVEGTQAADLYFTWTMIWAAFSLGLGGMGDRLLRSRLESENVFALAGISALLQIAFLSYSLPN